MSANIILYEILENLQYYNDPIYIDKCIKDLEKCDKSLVYRIFYLTWELSGKPTKKSHPEINHPDFGRMAFLYKENRSIPLETKVDIIKKVISEV
jgi:hypothetical protein